MILSLFKSGAAKSNAGETWAKYCFLGTMLITSSLVMRPLKVLYESPLNEDGYYVLTAARNIGLGNGITVDGVNLTNGFQPLWVFLSAPLFTLVGGDHELSIRLVLFAHWLLFGASAMLFGRIMDDVARAVMPGQHIGLRWIATLVFVGAGSVWVNFFNGLETGLQIFCYLVCLHIIMKIDQDNLLQLAFFGVSLGVLVLARIDSAIFVVIIAAAIFLVFGGSVIQRTGRFLAVSVSAFLVSVPWWAYNVVKFGDLVPSSGRALQGFDVGPFRIKHAIHAILQVLAPQIYLEGESRLVSVLRLASLVTLAVGVILIKRKGTFAAGAQGNALKVITFLGSLLIAYVVLIFYYTLDSWAWFFYYRYFVPLALVSLPIWVIVICFFLNEFGDIAKRGILLMLPVPTILLTIFGGHYSKVWSPSPFLNEQLPLVRQHVELDAWVGGLQSGTLGFFRDHVINLDGRVNAEVLPQRHDLLNYLDRKGVKWLADWDWLMDPYLKEPDVGRWKKVARLGSMSLYRRQ